MYISRQLGQPTPEQMDLLQQENAKVVAKQTARSRIPPATLLQNALKALGTAQGDPTLSKLKVDGAIGPLTVKAVNYALKTYLGNGGQLTLTQVRQQAAPLGDRITDYVTSHGGVVPPPHRKEPPTIRTPVATSFAPASIPVQASPLSFLGGNTLWYIVGGVSLLLALSVVSTAARRKRVGAEA